MSATAEALARWRSAERALGDARARLAAADHGLRPIASRTELRAAIRAAADAVRAARDDYRRAEADARKVRPRADLPVSEGFPDLVSEGVDPF